MPRKKKGDKSKRKKKKTEKEEHPSQLGGKHVKVIWECNHCGREQGALLFDAYTARGKLLLRQFGWDKKSSVIKIGRPCCVQLKMLMEEMAKQGYQLLVSVESVKVVKQSREDA